QSRHREPQSKTSVRLSRHLCSEATDASRKRVFIFHAFFSVALCACSVFSVSKAGGDQRRPVQRPGRSLTQRTQSRHREPQSKGKRQGFQDSGLPALLSPSLYLQQLWWLLRNKRCTSAQKATDARRQVK